jgi:type II secretory pathway component PulJ
MRSKILQNFVVSLVSLSLLSLGLAQVSNAAMIGTQQVVRSEARDARITRIETILARNDVARQLVAFGVDPLAVQSRVGNMTDAELLALEGGLDKQVAGGDVVAIVGVVFIVLIILELMGITDIFKST